MINTCKLSKGVIIFLVYYPMLILTKRTTINNGIKQNIGLIQNLISKDTDEKIAPKTIATTMQSIQLGIRDGMNNISSQPVNNLKDDDFITHSEKQYENWSDINNNNLSHKDFKFTIYAPNAFRYFRQLFNIEEEDYVKSFCDKALIEFPNPGASKSLFYRTPDDKFIMKTVQRTEAECLLKFLSGYKTHMKNNPNSLLPKFFGFYGFEQEGSNIKLISMKNVLPSSIKMHEKYDLKGSTYGRRASDSEKKNMSPTFKDLDFNNQHHPKGLYLKADTRLALLENIENDCKILVDFNIMDYSILMGIYYIDHHSNEITPSETTIFEIAAIAKWKSLMDNSTNDEFDQTLSQTLVDKMYPLNNSVAAKSNNGERLLLFIGIIDILQTYRAPKQLEYVTKSFVFKFIKESAPSISVQPPYIYASRFVDYMKKSVFKRLKDLPEQQSDTEDSNEQESTKAYWHRPLKKPRIANDDI